MIKLTILSSNIIEIIIESDIIMPNQVQEFIR